MDKRKLAARLVIARYAEIGDGKCEWETELRLGVYECWEDAGVIMKALDECAVEDTKR